MIIDVAVRLCVHSLAHRFRYIPVFQDGGMNYSWKRLLKFYMQNYYSRLVEARCRPAKDAL